MNRLDMGERIERNLMDARTGERKTFRGNRTDGFSSANLNRCEHCGQYRENHHFDTSIPFCPEWALRERWGK